MNNRILPFGKTLKSYLRDHGEKRPNFSLCCRDEACNKRILYKHGRYFRWVTTKYSCILIPIYRWYCPSCGKTVSLLPDFLIPWARFVTTVREGAFNRRKMRWYVNTKLDKFLKVCIFVINRTYITKCSMNS
jgi:hypothetical protein